MDAKLFACLVEAATGKANLKHSQPIEIEVVLGKGRQALKVFDKAKLYGLTELVSRASSRHTTLVCAKNADLEVFIVRFKYESSALLVSDGAMPEPIAIKLLKKDIENCEIATAALAAWKVLDLRVHTLKSRTDSLQGEG